MDCFTEIGTLDIDIEIKDEWMEYHDFQVQYMDVNTVFKNELLKKIYDKYPFTCGIIWVKPNTCYNWHRDENRGVSINMLISDTDSRSIFKTNNDIVFGIKELKYKPNTMYLFNSQITHAVMNFEGDRYLFTIEFNNDKQSLSYEELKEYINGLK